MDNIGTVGPERTADWRIGLRLQGSFLIACGLTMAAIIATGQQTNAPDASLNDSQLAVKGERDLEDGRSTLDEATLTAARKVFQACVRQDDKSFPCFYGLARTESNLVTVKEIQKDSKAAEHFLDSAIENVRRAIEINDRSSEAHALLADLYGRKIGYGGMFAGMRFGPKANAETRRAFELDENNPLAYAVVGRKYLFAPKMFGGDLSKAVQSFEKATTLDPHYDEAFVWLAIAYRKTGDSRRAQIALSQALRLNSRSVFAKRIQSETGIEVQ